MLFVELALIRWLGSNILYMSYFSNFVLLGSFLGIGAGFLRAHAPTNLFPWAPAALTLLVAFVRIFPVEVDRSSADLIHFGSPGTSGLPVWLVLPVLFVAVAATMAMIAEGVARSFVTFKPLMAYRLDVAGSIAGIVGFTIMSFLRAPPIGWGLVAALLLFVLVPPTIRHIQVTAVVGLTAMLLVESLGPLQSWSPYYRVTTIPHPVESDIYSVSVNGIPHQLITSAARRRDAEPVYVTVYERAPSNPLEDVLVVGAGNGTDVALALEQGAQRIDAVEIDPRLYELGYELHPDKPYQDERVTIHIEDARAFLERTGRKYDLILFALPDSLTLVAGQSSLRLESYLFTLEAMEQATRHLKPDGVFSMYNYYRERWLVDRLAGTLQTAFGRAPCVDGFGGGGVLAVLTASVDPAAVDCPERWQPASAAVPAPSTDDHPFVYLRTRTIPGFYLVTIVLILLASALSIRRIAGSFRTMAPYLDLFWMGTAFLLLETKNVVQFSLLFGSTWVVNAIVFTGILATVLLAIEYAERWPLRRPAIAYALLLGSLALAWAIHPQDLLQLNLPLRLLAATALSFTPVFLANVIFAERFKDVAASGVAFATNLLGAMVGGLLEYSSLILGYNALLGLVAALYVLAFISHRQVAARSAQPGPAV